VALDKLDKIGKTEVLAEMISKGIAPETAETYFSTVTSLVPNDTLTSIFEYLASSGFDSSWYKFEPTLARSFSYSTGPIWEIKIPEFSGGSVLGGERFDKLVEKVSGKQIPGTGFGLGFDRTLEAADQFGLIPTFKTNTKILVTIFSNDLTSAAMNLSCSLRQSGIPTELYPDPTAKLDKQLKYASQKGIPYVVIIGDTEISQNKITLKNLSTGTQELLSFKELQEKIANS
jgi:histidyl-tRNA synthetase